jgi:hydrogenase maturation protein HypF
VRVVAHGRRIERRADDPVLRSSGRSVISLRRGRGQVPEAIDLGGDGPAVLAFGAHLKNTVAVARGRRAWVSAHIGDLDTPAAVAAQDAAVHELLLLTGAAPTLFACDLHPDYASTRLAERRAEGRPLLRVQHHHAHLAAVLAATGVTDPVLGIALDGHGLGSDGSAWGGELLRVDGADCARLGHFAPLALPGGERAAREPWRMAAAALQALGRGDEIARRFADEAQAQHLPALLAAGSCSATSAAGRLFDAAAGLLGVCLRQRYEGEAAMRLEALARQPAALPGGFSLAGGVLDFRPLLAALADGVDAATGAALFHGTLIDGLVAWARDASARTGIRRIALAGGCFANAHLARALPDALRRAGLEPLQAWEQVPPGDAGIALGQAWVARAAWAAGRLEAA